MTAPNFVYVTYIRTTPRKLWAALTRGDVMGKYWHARIESTWKVGAPVRTFAGNGRQDWDGKVLDYAPFKRLSYTFQILGYMKRSSRILFELEPAGPAVKLTLSHYGVEAPRRNGIAGGWPVYFSSLKTLLETGKGMDVAKL